MTTRTKGRAVALSFAALTACTQVLGLEEAKLSPADDGEGPADPSGPRSVPVPGTACEEAPMPDCTTCLQGCGSTADRCVAGAACRRDMDRYAKCLGTRCNEDQEGCALDIEDQDLFACLSECAGKCERTKLVAPCELYCACMEEFCAGEADVIGDCLATCQALPADVRDCRRDHCEWGRGDAVHCQHASNQRPLCMPLGDDGPELCGAGKERTWACDADSECCSRDCGDGACR